MTTLANPRSALSVATIFATAAPIPPSLMLSLAVMTMMVAMRFRRCVDRAAGACLILFGARLAVEPRPSAQGEACGLFQSADGRPPAP